MALAGRTSRRSSSGRRWLILGVTVTLFVLLIDASLKSASTNSTTTLSNQAWIDQILPLIRATNSEGAVLQQVRTQAIHTPAATISSQLATVGKEAQATYQQAVSLHPPVAVEGAAGLLEACLAVRAQAAGEFAKAMGALLSSPVPQAGQSDVQANAVVAAAQDMEVSDRAYQLFSDNLPDMGFTPPPSAWVPDHSLYQPDTMATFAVTLRNSTSLTPVHQLAIDAISTNPSPVSTAGGVEVLPIQNGITVTVVVADVGNQAEHGLTITASALPAVRGGSVREFADLQPGQAQSIQLGDLYPLQGPLVTLTLTVTPARDSPAAVVSRSVTIQMLPPGVAPSTTTTSTTTPGTLPPGTGSTTTTSSSSTSTPKA